MNSVSMNLPASATTAASTTASQSATSSGGGINANDFMTLLVSELKNQDPTQPQDPAQYVQQLVGVNSLQQLIGIHQDLSSLTTTSVATS